MSDKEVFEQMFERAETAILSSREWRMLIDALENPPEPTEALRRAVRAVNAERKELPSGLSIEEKRKFILGGPSP